MFFSILADEKYVTPRVGPFMAQGHNLNKLGRGPLGDATYQIWFQTRRFLPHTAYISICETCDPWGGAIFGLRGIILTTLIEVF